MLYTSQNPIVHFSNEWFSTGFVSGTSSSDPTPFQWNFNDFMLLAAKHVLHKNIEIVFTAFKAI